MQINVFSMPLELSISCTLSVIFSKLMFPLQPDVPFEEVELAAQVFSSWQFSMGVGGPEYREWYAKANHKSQTNMCSLSTRLWTFSMSSHVCSNLKRES